MVMYCINTVLLLVFEVSSIVKAVILGHFEKAICFLVDPYYQVLTYLMIAGRDLSGIAAYAYDDCHIASFSNVYDIVFNLKWL